MSLVWLLTSEALLDMRLRGLHGGVLSICNFFRNSGGRRISMGRDILLVTSCTHIKELSAISVQLAHIKTQRVKVNMTAFSTPIGRADYSYQDKLGMTMRKPVTFLQCEDSHSIKDSGVISIRRGRVGQNIVSCNELKYLQKSSRI